MDKVIKEFRVIETDDGYRIEIKGDKEHLKSFIHGFGPFRGRSRGRHFGGHHGFGFGPMMFAHGGECCGHWDVKGEDEETGEASEE